MKKPTPPHIAAQINQKSNELIKEFHKHREGVVGANPQMTDERKIFEGWAIQKIAGLQCLVLDLVGRVCDLESRNRS